MKNKGQDGALSVRKRHTPHWELRGSTYFITWRLEKTQQDLSAQEKDIVVSAIKHFHGERYTVFAYVIMNDHVHVLASLSDGESLSKVLHSWKSFTANQLQRKHGRKGLFGRRSISIGLFDQKPTCLRRPNTF